MQEDLEPLRTYAHERIGRHLQARDAPALALFRAAKLTDYTYMKTHKYSDADVRTMLLFPFVDESMVMGLLWEKEDFFMFATDTDNHYGYLAFWDLYKKKLPVWHALVMDIVLVQPSPAFMERVFSILRACFDKRQEQVYSDRICASALLKYNRGRDRGSSGLRVDQDAPEIPLDGGGDDGADGAA